jgi:membrane fusion protein, multidrug efflux system
MADPTPSDKPQGDQEFEFPALHGEEPAAPKEAAPPPPPETPDASGMPPPPQGWFARHRSFGLFLTFILIAGGMYVIRKMRSGGEVPPEEQQQQQQGPDEVPVNAIEARIGRFQDTINAVGSLKGEAEVELRFQVEGRIDDLSIMEGAKVRKGQLLGRLSDRDAQLKVQRAKIELEQTEKLYQIGGVSKTKLDEARLNMEVAQTELDKTRLIASREGIIGEKEAEMGEFVNPQRKIAKLVSIKNVIVEVGIIEKQVDKIYPGQKLLITVDAYPGNIFEGTIETISPIIGSDGSKTFSVRSKIPNPDSLLLPGMFARSKIITYEADDAISVPNDSLNKTPGGFQVFVINKENVAEARDVQVGYVATEFTQIESGLNPGEIVVVQKPPELKAGSKVKIIEVQK